MKWAIELSFKEADYGIHPNHHMSAVIVKGGRVLNKKPNILLNRKVKYNGKHAEERALNIKNRENLIGATIIITRKNHRNERRTMSRPCQRCYASLVKAGIKKIVYINWDGQITIERIKKY
jgi:pyrimidine deaminase RibD-like protein